MIREYEKKSAGQILRYGETVVALGKLIQNGGALLCDEKGWGLASVRHAIAGEQKLAPPK